MNLPVEFTEKMKKLLKEEYEDFLKSYDENKSRGLRINTLKISIEDFIKINPFNLEKIPWVKEGFYYGEEDRPGKHPYHEAGLYYIQEPSAMAVVEILNPNPGEKILDLSAAPGGKATHIASKMQGEGFLLANEIHPARAKILARNIERLGIKNAVVTNESPSDLSKEFIAYFDKILVDAPCSGEGMFRKDYEACNQWSIENVKMCANRQLDILQEAATMLKVGGRLVYSTCTFSPEENEGTISKFLKLNPNFEIEDIKTYEGFSKGRGDWVNDGNINIDKTIRIWPHKVKGEGHYIAVLKKIDGKETPKAKAFNSLKDTKILKSYFEFCRENLNITPKGEYILFGEQLYIMPKEMISLKNLKIIKPGWHLGTIKKNIFKPSHALALSLKDKEANYKINFNRDSKEIISYLKGETIRIEGEKGWYLIEVDGYSIGWGKLSNNTLKNHYPKGLRWL
ncbi:RsmF rRNA methyltransferase first C-terminal domain-containing protein [Defluviitalea phaphyphila]|uniref:RsmF rRNA methyltransferase first C-terminal domain-containing protein n=1 Tax=Defluviitalea phaphyphila TaxID=1473580 RepID=UPI00073194BD|nr:RsmB/NOP family class I SAM-dependent RNA methyltransferase [Defluviitalea phaphyphila]